MQTLTDGWLGWKNNSFSQNAIPGCHVQAYTVDVMVIQMRLKYTAQKNKGDTKK